jgi:DNA-binding transcriptional LysR family regulator
MIALRIGSDFRQALVGAPSYFARRTPPATPHDLTDHACINLRLPTSGGLWSWPFARDGRELKVRVEGPLAFNGIPLILSSALAGLGLAYLPADVVQEHVAAGRLVRVLENWSPLMTGYHLYYPDRQPSPAFVLLVGALRYRSEGWERQHGADMTCSPSPPARAASCALRTVGVDV